MDHDAASLYPSAMWVDNSVHSKVESGFAIKPHMNHVYVEVFDNQTFNQNDKESAILRINCSNPETLLFQHKGVKEKVKNQELIRLRNGYLIDVLTLVDFQGFV